MRKFTTLTLTAAAVAASFAFAAPASAATPATGPVISKSAPLAWGGDGFRFRHRRFFGGGFPFFGGFPFESEFSFPFEFGSFGFPFEFGGDFGFPFC